MHLVAIAWLYVVVMMAAAEALSARGSWLGAVFTLLLYGVLPLSIVLYIGGWPGRRRARRRAQAQEDAAAARARSGSAVPVAEEGPRLDRPRPDGSGAGPIDGADHTDS